MGFMGTTLAHGGDGAIANPVTALPGPPPRGLEPAGLTAAPGHLALMVVKALVGVRPAATQEVHSGEQLRIGLGRPRLIEALLEPVELLVRVAALPPLGVVGDAGVAVLIHPDPLV